MNRLVNNIAPRAPGFGVVVHRGRRSGRVYRTPVNLVRQKDGFLIALTYGSESDWVRNVLAAGGCELIARGQRHVLDTPRVYRDERRTGMPGVARVMLRALDVSEFMTLRTAA